MKKASKLLVGLALSGMLLTGCNFNQKSINADNAKRMDIYELYAAEGGTLTYEEWLESIKGADGSSFSAGAADPDNANGKAGDVYVNTTNWHVFIKLGNAWSDLGSIKGADGAQGLQGPEGPQGPQGPQGPAGNDGNDGKDGKDGNSFYSDFGNPADDFGIDGDTYLNLDTFDIFKKEEGKWNRVANMKHGLYPAELTEEMYFHFGEELPYAPLNNDSIYSEFEFEPFEFFGYVFNYASYTFGDESSRNALADYGDALIDAGFEYDDYYEEYVKECARGYEITVTFEFDEDAGNMINVSTYDYLEPYSAEYFEENGFELSAGWPAENVALTLDPLTVEGVNKDGAWYESFGEEEDEYGLYYYDMLATEGSWSLELAANIEAAGFIYDEEYNIFVDDLDTQDRQARIDERDGWTVVSFFGAYRPLPDYEPDLFIQNGYTLNNGFPYELMQDAMGQEEIFAGFNEEADWYVSPAPSSGTGYTQTKVWAGTYGDFLEDADAVLTDFGFVASEDSEGLYTLDIRDDYRVGPAQAYVAFERGWTFFNVTGPKIYPDGAPVMYALDQLNDKMSAFFKDAYDLDVEFPEYEAANEEAFFEIDAATKYLTVYGSSTSASDNQEEMHAFAAAIEELGWTKSISSYSGDATLTKDDMKIVLYTMSTYFQVRMSYTPKFGLDQLNDKMAAFFAAQYELEVEFPEYVAANEEAYFIQNTSYANYFDVYGSSDGDKTNQEEMHAFAAACEELGWKKNIDTYGDTTLTKAGKKVVLYTYTGYFQVRMSYTPVNTVFPLAEVNEFLTTYGLGFQLAEALPDPDGEGYTIQQGVNASYGYHYYIISISGNYVAEMKAIIGPLVTGDLGYEWSDNETGTGGYYYDEVTEHEIDVVFSGGSTFVKFFE